MSAAPTDQAVPEERRLKLTRADTIRSKRQRWLWQDRIPAGTTTIFGGIGGEGKSTFALHIAAQTNGGTLEGDMQGQPVSVLIVSHEDDWGTVMVPRLKAAGADLSRIYHLQVESTMDEYTHETVPALPMDLRLIENALEQTGAKLIIFDPITSAIDGDPNKTKEVRRAVDPVSKLAQDHEVTVIAIMHFNKGGGRAEDKLSGSHSFRDIARSVLLFATDKETGQRVVTFNKGNYSKMQGNSFAFNLVSTSIDTDDGEQAEVARIEYLGETDLDVETIINRELGSDDDQADSDDAAKWLYEYLVSVGGSAKRKDVEKASRAEGFSEKVLRRAREKARIETSRQGFPSSTIWTVSTPVTPSEAQSRPSQGVGTSGPDRARLDDKREAEVVQLFPKTPANFAATSDSEPAVLEGFDLTPPPTGADRHCVVCEGSLAGRRVDAKTCSPTCRKKLSDQNKEIS